MAASILSSDHDGTAARGGSEGRRLPSASRYLNTQNGPYPPLLSLSRACLLRTLPSSVSDPSPLRYSIAHELILLQNRDVEKDTAGHQQSASRPESERSLDDLNLSSKLQNPLAGKDKATLEEDAVNFCKRHGLTEHGVWQFLKVPRTPWPTFAM